MASKTWPLIRKTKNHGKDAWLVDARIKGEGERRFFPSRPVAETWATQRRVLRQNHGDAAFGDKELSKYGWTVSRAVQFALEHLRKQAASVSVSHAVNALCASKESKVGADRLTDIRNRLTRFSKFFEGRVIATINEAEISEFLNTIKHPTTQNDYRKEIVMLWKYCTAKNRGWAGLLDTKNELTPAREPEKARIILTVEQAAQLMEASIDEDILALNALVLFGGVRREEVEKMNWRHIELASGHINITSDISKVHTERYSPISENLMEWLEPIAQKSGPLVTRNLMRPLRETWKRAGIYPWPQDAHRHSFISYRRQLVGDAQTSLEAGTSEKIIKKHYKRPVTTVQAQAFFQISPKRG